MSEFYYKNKGNNHRLKEFYLQCKILLSMKIIDTYWNAYSNTKTDLFNILIIPTILSFALDFDISSIANNLYSRIILKVPIEFIG